MMEYTIIHILIFIKGRKQCNFPDNTVSVRVDAHTGKVRSANINWLRGVRYRRQCKAY